MRRFRPRARFVSACPRLGQHRMDRIVDSRPRGARRSGTAIAYPCERHSSVPEYGAGTSDERRRPSPRTASQLVVQADPAGAVRAGIGRRAEVAHPPKRRAPRAPPRRQAMKKVEAIIKPFKLDEVKEALTKQARAR